MKAFTKKSLVVLVIVMILAVMPAFGDEDFDFGPDGPNLGDDLKIVSGCVLVIYDNTIDGIMLCQDKDTCPECPDDLKTTILGIGPEFYWQQPYTVKLNNDGSIKTIYEPDGKVDYPEPGDFVTIGALLNSDESALVALWVQTEDLKSNIAVLLRDPDTLECLWKSLGKNK